VEANGSRHRNSDAASVATLGHIGSTPRTPQLSVRCLLFSAQLLEAPRRSHPTTHYLEFYS